LIFRVPLPVNKSTLYSTLSLGKSTKKNKLSGERAGKQSHFMVGVALQTHFQLLHAKIDRALIFASWPDLQRNCKLMSTKPLQTSKQ
jgi:hypothetical protein